MSRNRVYSFKSLNFTNRKWTTNKRASDSRENTLISIIHDTATESNKRRDFLRLSDGIVACFRHLFVTGILFPLLFYSHFNGLFSSYRICIFWARKHWCAFAFICLFYVEIHFPSFLWFSGDDAQLQKFSFLHSFPFSHTDFYSLQFGFNLISPMENITPIALETLIIFQLTSAQESQF